MPKRKEVTTADLLKEIKALREEVAALRAQVTARPTSWYPWWPYPYGYGGYWGVVTDGTSATPNPQITWSSGTSGYISGLTVPC